MGVEQETKVYVPTSPDESRDTMLEDLNYLYAAQGITKPPTQKGSDIYLEFTALGTALYLAQQAQAYNAGEILLASCQEDASVEDKATMFGVEIPVATAARGKVKITTSGTVNVNSKHMFVLPSGVQGHVDGTFSGLIDGAEVPVVVDATGVAGNAKGGTKVKWLNAPLGAAVEAVVSSLVPLTGGQDAPTLEDKKAFVRERLRNPLGAVNPAALVKAAKSSGVALNSVSVYPALSGPSTVKVVVLKDMSPDILDFSRNLDQATLVQVRTAVQTQCGWESESIVTGAVEVPVDVPLTLEMRPGGWTDTVPWPVGTATTLQGTASKTLNWTNVSGMAGTPVVGNSVSWFSQYTKKFYTRIITATGEGSITLDSTMQDDLGNFPATGDFLSPASPVGDDLVKQVLSVVRKLVPGEQVLGNWRALRTGDEGECRIIEADLKAALDSIPQVRSVTLASGTLSPSVQTSVNVAPNVLTLKRISMYPVV